MSRLFAPAQIGPYTLSHRVVMAPLTRMRSGPGNIPGDLMVEYYRQRASGGGLIISEATPVSLQGYGYAGAPGIYSDSQIAGWKRITDAVHAKGGRIMLQLWHVGRQSQVDLQPNGEAPVAPSAIRAEGHAFTAHGEATFGDVTELLDRRGIAYLHVIEPRIKGIELMAEGNEPIAAQHLRPKFSRTLIAAGGFTRESAEAIINAGDADLVAFGRSLSPTPTCPSDSGAGSLSILTTGRPFTAEEHAAILIILLTAWPRRKTPSHAIEKCREGIE